MLASDDLIILSKRFLLTVVIFLNEAERKNDKRKIEGDAEKMKCIDACDC